SPTVCVRFVRAISLWVSATRVDARASAGGRRRRSRYTGARRICRRPQPIPRARERLRGRGHVAILAHEQAILDGEAVAPEGQVPDRELAFHLLPCPRDIRARTALPAE
ncbi:hypothetical protein DFH08DRAFT_883670, partial [Mycena albidolilacea]